MKKSLYLILPFLCLFINTNAQNEVDALRYSQSFRNASARSISMGGAFGALGADLSALSGNPAGLGVYRRAALSFTTGFGSIITESDFLDTKIEDGKNKPGMESYGIVFPVFRKTNTDWKSVNFGFSFNKINDFNKNVYMKGINNNSSMVNEFLYTANMNNEFDPFSDGLAWETYLIDYDSIGDYYYGDFEEGTSFGQEQSKSINTRGSMGEYTFSLGGNYNDYLYIGASISIQNISYYEDSEFMEDDPEDRINFFNWFTYGYSQETTGSGYNVKLGAIYRPLDWIRIGAAVHTPTYIKFKDYWDYSMETSIEDGEEPHFSDQWGENDSYQELTTPFKAMTSVALVVKKAGIISVDYEYVDYSSIRLSSRSNDYFYVDENQSIKDMYQKTSNLHIGAEYKLGNIAFRGGYALYGSPYQSSEINKDAFRTSISGGIGIRNNNFSIDLVIVNTKLDEYYFLYYDNPALLKSTTNRILATIGFRF